MLKKLLAVITILCMGIMLVPVGLSAAASPAEFMVGENEYENLTDAIAAAKPNGVIYLSATGTLAAGNYTIPSGVTLYIPYAADSAPKGEEPDYDKSTAISAKPFLKLTLSENTNITVNGTIEVGGKYRYVDAGNTHGMRVLNYGQIELSQNSGITLENGSKLYAWGFITGEGAVEAKSGSNVYELFQITDFRGGTATTGGMGNNTAANDPDKKHFPFSQYYVQNVEAKLIFRKGAADTAYYTINAGDALGQQDPIKFIGDNGFYKVNSGTLTKWYDPIKDRLQIEIDGSAEIGSIHVLAKVKKEVPIFGLTPMTLIDNDTSEYNFPINATELHIKTNGAFTCPYGIELLPDSGIFIEKGGAFNIANNGVVYVYDTADWGGYVGVENAKCVPVLNTPTRPTANKRKADKSAFIDVAGLLNVQGDLKSTEHGADITGQHGGKVKYAKADNTNLHLWECTQSSTDITYVEIKPFSSQLKNGSNKPEKPYTDTAGRGGEMTYTYVADEPDHLAENGVWQEGDIAFYNVSFDANGGTGEPPAARPDGGVWTELPKDTKITLPGNTFTAPDEEHYFSGWLCDDDNRIYQPDVTYTMPAGNVTFTAQWADQIPINFKANAANCSGSMPPQYFKNEPLTLPANGFTCDGWTFDGWNTHPNGTGTPYADEAAIGSDAFTDGALTLYAQWKPAGCTVSFDANGGTGTMTAQNFEFNKAAALNCPTDFTREGYILAGWGTKADGSSDIYAPGGYYCFTDPKNMQVTLYALWLPNP